MHSFADKGYCVGNNQPYNSNIFLEGSLANLVDPMGYPNVIVEFNNSKVTTPENAVFWVGLLWTALECVARDKALDTLGDTSPSAYDKEKADAYFHYLIAEAKEGRIV